MIYCEPSLGMAIVTLAVIRRNREDGFPRYAGFPLADMALACAR
jgi:hypothetical protein